MTIAVRVIKAPQSKTYTLAYPANMPDQRSDLEAAAAPAPLDEDAYAIELKALEDYRKFACLTIQRFWRGFAVRAGLRREVRLCALVASAAKLLHTQV